MDENVLDSTNSIEAKTSIIENETIKLEEEEDLPEKMFKLLCLFKIAKDGTFKCKLRHREGVTKTNRNFCYRLMNSFQGTIDDHLIKWHNTNINQLKYLSEYVDGPYTIPLTVLVILNKFLL